MQQPSAQPAKRDSEEGAQPLVGDLSQAREWLAQASSVAVLTGAGISAESGVPTFRGAGGLWKDYKPEELATPEAFARDPRLVWEWYDWRREIIAKAQPNPAHRALVEIEKRKPRFTLITQNVDGLHDLAGSGKILKLHGDIWRMRCTACGANLPNRRVPLPKIPPHCACGGLARPGVVWFGEPLPEGMMKEAEHAACGGPGFPGNRHFGGGVSGRRADSLCQTGGRESDRDQPGRNRLVGRSRLRPTRSGGRLAATVILSRPRPNRTA